MPKPPVPSAIQTVSQLAALPAVHRAFQWFHLQEPQLHRWHCEIASIPAPTFGEATRATWLCAKFAALGLEDVHVDACGNALGWLRRTTADASRNIATDATDEGHASAEMDPSDRPCILFSAHIDTVFSVEAMRTPVEQGAVLFAPSASDNAAGVVALLALAAAMREANLRTGVDILFAGNVGEEGEGNLRGMRHLFTVSPFRQRITSAVVLDGAGHESVVTQGLGSRRFRVTITGPGGHSWSDAGTPNPVLALATALTEMQKLEVPRLPRTTWNVGRIEGGTVVNAIPEQAEALIDIRSTDPAQLLRLEVALYRAVEDAVLASDRVASQQPSNQHPTRTALEHSIAMVGERPAARLPESARLLAAIRAVDRHLGIRSELRTASTDANVPLSLGVEAISLGSGGSGGGMHTREEWFDATNRDLGLRRILLLLLALAQVPE
jgi:acetylornithine deacetylase/succinyl-diaminopimelate desuccinylase-like protein